MEGASSSRERMGSPHHLMSVPSAGGPSVDMQLAIRGLTQFNFLALHPDGAEVAYTAGEPGAELWAMRGFLPR